MNLIVFFYNKNYKSEKVHKWTEIASKLNEKKIGFLSIFKKDGLIIWIQHNNFQVKIFNYQNSHINSINILEKNDHL